MRKFLGLILIFMILISAVSPGLSAEETEYKGGYVPIPIDLSYLADNPPDENFGKPKLLRLFKNSTIPSTYDLRDSDRVTSIKTQQPYGTCWAFAGLGAMESNLLTQGKGTYDLSEMHLAWYAFRNSDSSKAFHSLNSETVKNVLDHGGNSFYTTALYSRLAGPVNESEVPYGENKNPSAAIPEAYNRVLRVREAFHLAMGENLISDSSARDVVKKRIMDYGAVVASYVNDNSAYQYNNSYGTSFYSKNGSGGHAVQIIGWDDNYSSGAFKTNPGMNGAWLIKNSWGNQWSSDGKTVGDNGCFWMSYAQKLEDGTAFVVEEADPEMKVYYYDALGWCGTNGYSGSVVYAANIFKSERNEKLTEVGFYTPNNNINYEVSVYKGLSSVSDSTPIKNSAVSTASGGIAYAGYHTVILDNAVDLSKGDVFSVVVKFNNYAQFVTEKTSANFSPNAKIETGSLLSPNGTSWTQCTDKNVCIKAFTVLSTTATAPKITSDYPPDAVVNQKYSFTPTATGTRPITWNLSGNVPAGLSINSSTGEISGTPTTVGSYNIKLTVTNSVGSDSENYTMNVRDVSITPTEITGYVSIAINEQLKLLGGTAKSWSITDGTLPRGLSLNKTSGKITGKPTVATSSTGTEVEFTVTTSTGDSYSQSVNFIINAKPEQPKFTTSSLPNGTVNVDYSQKIIVTGTDPITLTASGLPDGFNFNSDTGMLTGTPTLAKTYTIKFTASNVAKTVTKSLKLKINDVKPETISPATLNYGIVKEAYDDVTFSLASGTGTIKWSASGLPSGLKLNSSTGVLSGTPTRAGSFNVRITASNSAGKATETIPMVVYQKPEITTTKLANATTDKKYSATIKANGSETLEWDFSGLPDTLSHTFNANKTIATITGIPTEAEIYDVKVKVSNGVGSDDVTLRLTVKGVKPNLTVKTYTGKVDTNYTAANITTTGTKPITITYSISESDKTKFGINNLSDLGLDFETDPNLGTATITGKSDISIKNLPITFTATNSIGTVTKTAKITINGTKPSFANLASNYNFEVGEDVDIDFTVNGTPNITITMPTSNGISLTQNENSATITGIAPDKVNKKITLRVTAQNADGKVTKSIVIKTVASTSTAKTTSTKPEIEHEYELEISNSVPEIPTEKSALPDEPKEIEIQIEGEMTLGEERKIESLGADKLSKLENEGYKIAAILPEISVTKSDMYDLEIDLDQLKTESEDLGKFELFWFAFPKDVEHSEDDEICEFYDVEGNEIKTVPENHEISISAWFEEGIIYEPVIAVKKQEAESEIEIKF
ncbi:MAG: putative Ig domain-containing protein [Synergistaceae bacterium]|nr:putative Ig domain-containing protein [Synergistaceae bacterium]